MDGILSRTSAGLLAKVSALLCLCMVAGAFGVQATMAVTSGWAVLGIFVAVIVGMIVMYILNETVGPIIGIPLLGVVSYGVGAMVGPAINMYVHDLGWATVQMVFLGSAGVMMVLGFIGATTKRDLSALGPILFFALLGLIIVQFIGVFLPHVTGMNMLIGAAGAIIFAGYFLYDFQQAARDEDSWKAAVRHSFSIYLDFVNFALSILKILDDK